jgi:hypothetical protein
MRDTCRSNSGYPSHTPRGSIVAFLLILASAGCSDPNGPDGAGAVAKIIVVQGDNQSATVGTALPSQVVVRVVDAHEKGAPGVTVSFDVVAGGGGVTPATAVTDGEGLARANVTVGKVAAAAQQIRARAADPKTGTEAQVVVHAIAVTARRAFSRLSRALASEVSPERS